MKSSETPVAKKPTNIFQEKKSAAAAQKAQSDTPNRPIGRFAQLEKAFTSKDSSKISSATKAKESVKTEEKLAAESDIYEFNDVEDTPLASSVVKKQESPSESQTKKQSLAQQQRKQARAAVQQKEEPPQMEDIESMIKTSIVSLPMNKKQKKSPMKEDKNQSRTSVQSQQQQQPITTTVAPVSSSTSWDIYSKSSSTTNPNRKSESTFDVLRKSPSFNMHHGVDDFSSPSTATAIAPSPGKSQSFSSLTSSVPLKFGSSIPTQIDTHELLKPVMMPSKEEEKPELEAFKRILDPSFDILPKQEKQTLSVTDKLLKAFSQVDTSQSMEVKKEESFAKLAPVTSQKSQTKKDNNLDVVHPLESAVTSTTTVSLETTVVKKSVDDSDTDSDRLVIEDEDAATPLEERRKMGALETIMLQDDVTFKHSKDSEKKYSEAGEQQSETMSLLLCEETIPGSPAPASVKDPLSEIGRSPTSSGNFVQPQPQGKTISMDIDNDVELATGDILRDKLKSADRGSATSSGKNTNNNSENSNDDQSGSEKNGKRKLI